MRRPAVWIVAAVAVIVLATIGGVLIWRHTSVNSKADITLEQAGPIAARYAQDTAGHVPGQPALVPRLVNNIIPCNDPADQAAPGSAERNDIYDLKFTGYHDPAAAFDQIKGYWTGNGYKVVGDDPATLATRTLTVENPADGFRIGLARGAAGNLFITISSPCLRPGPTSGPTP